MALAEPGPGLAVLYGDLTLSEASQGPGGPWDASLGGQLPDLACKSVISEVMLTPGCEWLLTPGDNNDTFSHAMWYI